MHLNSYAGCSSTNCRNTHFAFHSWVKPTSQVVAAVLALRRGRMAGVGERDWLDVVVVDLEGDFGRRY